MRITDNYVFFYGKLEPYSNHYIYYFVDGETTFNCIEQYMMFHKAMLFNDIETAKEILNEQSPSIQKRMGRRVKNFDENIWNNEKEKIVYNGCKIKFGGSLKDELLKYKGKTFVEASGYDTIWGVGLIERDNRILNPSNWKGQNLLGNILTKLSQET